MWCTQSVPSNKTKSVKGHQGRQFECSSAANSEPGCSSTIAVVQKGTLTSQSQRGQRKQPYCFWAMLLCRLSKRGGKSHEGPQQRFGDSGRGSTNVWGGCPLSVWGLIHKEYLESLKCPGNQLPPEVASEVTHFFFWGGGGWPPPKPAPAGFHSKKF